MAADYLNAEYGVAGSILIDPAAFPPAAELVAADDFSSALCRTIFRAAQDLHTQGRPIDPVIVQKWGADHGQTLEDNALRELMEITPTAANVRQYAAIVSLAAKRRGLKAIAQRIVEDVDTPTEQLLADASAELGELLEKAAGKRCLSSSDQMRSFYDDLAARESGRKNMIPSGFPKLDGILGGGFLRGGLYIVAARPGMGKTTFALNLTDQIKGGVLFVSLEMSENQLAAKRIASVTGIPSHRLLSGYNMTEEEHEKIASAAAALASSGVVMNKRCGATVAEIAAMARTVEGLSAVVVDYLGLIQPGNARVSRYEATTEISGALKRLAISLNVPVIALAQLNRAAESREDKRPRISDLRDSGSIEQDADGVLLLYRSDYYNKEPKQRWEPSLIELEVAKNRHAGCGVNYFNGYLAVSKMVECG